MDDLAWQRLRVLHLLRDPSGGSVPGIVGRVPAPMRPLAAAVADALDRSRGADTLLGGAAALAAATDWLSAQAPSAPLVLSHPLARAPLRLAEPTAGPPALVAPERLEDVVERVQEPGWGDLEALRSLADVAWRLAWDGGGSAGVQGEGSAYDAVAWTWRPASAGMPDATTWDTSRMASALGFFQRTAEDRERGGPDEPWFLSFEVGPVGTFVGEARSSRDLWAGSFLLADVAFAAMEPILDALGPASILYPDLRGNPRADRWLWDQERLRGRLPEADPKTRAAVIPNHWVAVLPGGALGNYAGVEALADKCVAAARGRWDTLQRNTLKDTTRDYREVGGHEDELARAWTEQHQRVLTTTWTAAPWPWLRPGELTRPPGRALVSQGPDGSTPADRPRASSRADWFTPLLANEALLPTAQTLGLLEQVVGPAAFDRRGSDYALHHHRLQALHAARRLARPAAIPSHLPAGEACTMCRKRPQLGPTPSAHVDTARSQRRGFWEAFGARLREPRFGEERLCAVCLTKRRLVPLGKGDVSDPNRTWTGRRRHDDGEGREQLRFPFPSTAMVAAQPWLQWVLRHPDMRDPLRRLVDAAREDRYRSSAAPDALPALTASAALAPDPGLAQRVLALDGQVYYAGALEAALARGDSGGEAVLVRSRELARAAKDRSAAAGEDASEPVAAAPWREACARVPAPPARIAVLAMDGDSLGKLLLGSGIRATWSDVAAQAPPWPGPEGEALAARPRLVGPAVHAAISRMLVDFAHRVVPWVIEQEFRGRLVYAGGDDVLALLPADDALPAAARLQWLYNQPWLLDTRPDVPNGGLFAGTWNGESALARFQAVHGDLPSGGRLLQMPGMHHSLSAGIAYGHFKTPLGHLVRRARELLDEVAKGELDRAAVAVSLGGRGGEKVLAAAKWSEVVNEGGKERLTALAEGFRTGAIPGKLPYQLYETARAVLSFDPNGEDGTTAQAFEDLARRLYAHTGGDWRRGPGSVFDQHVEALFLDGVRWAWRWMHPRRDRPARPTEALWAEDPRDAAAHRAVATLRFARALADSGEEDDR